MHHIRCLSSDSKVYMEPLEGRSSPAPTSSNQEPALKSESSRKISTSMNRIKALTKLGSHNYEQIRAPPESDTSAGVPISSHRNLATCRNISHVGEMLLRVDDNQQFAGDSQRTPTGQVFSNGVDASSQRGLPSKLTVHDEFDRSLTCQALHTDLVSFDDVPRYHQRRENNTSVAAGAEPGVASPRLPARVQVAAEEYQSRQRENGHRKLIQHEAQYDIQNDLLPDSFSRCNQVRSAGAVTISQSSRRKAKSFDFGTIPEPDPPTRLIGEFLRRQTESGSNFLDLDLDMDELIAMPNPKYAGKGNISSAIGFQRQSTTSRESSVVKESPYGDLSDLDHFIMSASTSSKGTRSPNTGKGLEESVPYCSDRSLNHPLQTDVRLNIIADDRNVNGVGTVPSVERKEGGTDSSGNVVGLRSRKNGSSPQRAPTAESQVLKAPAEYVSRQSFSRLKSRLADLPKPPKSAVMDEKSAQMKSGQVKTSGQLRSELVGKLKKVDEEEEDPLKVTDLPERYRKREKGFWVILQWVAFVCISAGLITILAFSSLRKMKRGGLMLWKWALLVMVVFSGRLISGWIVWALVFVIEKNFLLRKRVVYFVYALRKGVQNCLWLGLALLAWHFMIDPKVDHNVKIVKYVTKLLICFLVAAVIVLGKTLLVKVFASSFHVSNFFERIQEALFSQYIMETLAEPPSMELQENYDEEQKLYDEISRLKEVGATGPSLARVPDLPTVNDRSGGTGRQSMNTSGPGARGEMPATSGKIGVTPKAGNVKKVSGSQKELNQGISVDHLHKLDQTNISAWNMKRLIHIIRHSTLTHSLEETISAADGMETEIQSEWQAKSAAKQIFKNVAKPGQKVITEDDLLRFMSEEETKRALALFDGAIEKSCISKQALKSWVIKVYRERRALALSLNDTKTAVDKLHRIFDVLVGILIIVIWLLVLGIATTKLLLFMSSQILLLILVWGNTLKTVLEAIIFLFVMHPFDVGDRCVIDGMQLVVEEMNILTTVFLGDFNVKIWFPNSVLATKPIQNYYRSPEMGDCVEIIVQACTPVEKIGAFKEKIGKYIESKTNHWHQEFVLNILEMSEGEKMKLSLGLKHTMNYQDMGEKVKRKSELLVEVKACLQQLGIQYRAPAQQVHIRKLTD